MIKDDLISISLHAAALAICLTIAFDPAMRAPPFTRFIFGMLSAVLMAIAVCMVIINL
jgi:hypothetical protein